MRSGRLLDQYTTEGIASMKDSNDSLIRTPEDALLWLEAVSRFGGARQSLPHFSAVANVIRELMHRLESQALAMEREEAKREQES